MITHIMIHYWKDFLVVLAPVSPTTMDLFHLQKHTHKTILLQSQVSQDNSLHIYSRVIPRWSFQEKQVVFDVEVRCQEIEKEQDSHFTVIMVIYNSCCTLNRDVTEDTDNYNDNKNSQE